MAYDDYDGKKDYKDFIIGFKCGISKPGEERPEENKR
jgi:hypothetical protein